MLLFDHRYQTLIHLLKPETHAKKNSSKYIQWKAGKIRCQHYQLTRNWGEWDDQILGDFTRWIQANIQIPNCDSVHNQKKNKIK